MNQCWIIVNWTLKNKLQWNLNRNSNIFIEENAFESVVCETAAILSQPQCVKIRWSPCDLSVDESALVQVMAWCHQATNITWDDVDPVLCRHMASLAHNELIFILLFRPIITQSKHIYHFIYIYIFQTMKQWKNIMLSIKPTLSPKKNDSIFHPHC